MDQRRLEIEVISARDLKDVNLVSKMDVYAVVSIAGGGGPYAAANKQRTTVDRDGGTNPTWNFPMKFSIDHSAAACSGRLALLFQLRCDRKLGDKDVGEVNVQVNELLAAVDDGGKGTQFVSYQVWTPSGKPKGVLNFSYKFGEKVAEATAVQKPVNKPVMAYPVAAAATAEPKPVNEPAIAYPAATAGPSSGYYGVAAAPYPPPGEYPPPAAGYGGLYPPVAAQPGYGYPPPPPPQPGYGYPGVQPQRRRNGPGMGVGAGLIGGALGGLLIGDALSDGFGDGFGF